MARVQDIIVRVQKLKAVRVLVHYLNSRGPLLAGGLSFQSIFAVFATLWVGFSVAGLLIDANPDIRQAFFRLVSTSVPGLIETDAGEGIVDPDDLQTGLVLSWTGGVALVGLLFTVLGWLESCREAVRTIFGLPGELLNFFLLKLKDLGLGIAFGAAILVSAALLVVSTQALTFFGIGEDSVATTILGRIISLALMFVLDAAALAALFRALSGLAIPWRRLLAGSLLGAGALGILKLLGTLLLGGATRNPLLASFALIIGLLIWFNLICQVILLAGSWIAVGMADAGLIADPKVEAERRKAQQRRVEKLAADRSAAEAAAENTRRRNWWQRALGRDKDDGGRR